MNEKQETLQGVRAHLQKVIEGVLRCEREFMKVDKGWFQLMNAVEEERKDEQVNSTVENIDGEGDVAFTSFTEALAGLRAMRIGMEKLHDDIG